MKEVLHFVICGFEIGILLKYWIEAGVTLWNFMTIGKPQNSFAVVRKIAIRFDRTVFDLSIKSYSSVDCGAYVKNTASEIVNFYMIKF